MIYLISIWIEALKIQKIQNGRDLILIGIKFLISIGKIEVEFNMKTTEKFSE